jgi:hypothetical protein
MKTLIRNFVKQEIAPRELVTATSGPGMLYKASAAVASEFKRATITENDMCGFAAGLFSVMTLGIGPRLMPQGEVEDLDIPLLATQSLLLTLVLANHCTSDSGLSNPYRQALFSFNNAQGALLSYLEYVNKIQIQVKERRMLLSPRSKQITRLSLMCSVTH